MIEEIRVEESLWAGASPLRRHDWRVAIADLLEDADLGAYDDRRMLILRNGESVVCVTFDAHGAPRGRHEIRDTDLRPHVQEYLAIIRRLHADDESAHSARMAAFDMAKKVVHDGAAKTLARAMPGLAREHETYRRLFSLLFSVVVDVTTLPGARAHRRHVMH